MRERAIEPNQCGAQLRSRSTTTAGWRGGDDGGDGGDGGDGERGGRQNLNGGSAGLGGSGLDLASQSGIRLGHGAKGSSTPSHNTSSPAIVPRLASTASRSVRSAPRTPFWAAASAFCCSAARAAAAATPKGNGRSATGCKLRTAARCAWPGRRPPGPSQIHAPEATASLKAACDGGMTSKHYHYAPPHGKWCTLNV